jgi:hypothetical protein
VPRFDANAAATASGGLLSLGVDWGRLLALILLAAVILTYIQRRTFPVRLTSLCVMLLVYWSSIALLRGAEADPAQTRYIFVGGVLLTLIVTELAAGRVGVGVPTRAVVAIAAIGTFAIALNGLQSLREMLPFFHEKVRVLLPELTAVEIARDTLPPEMPLNQGRVPGGTVRLYLAAVDAYGSPALSEAGLAKATPDGRAAADFILVQGARTRLAQQRGRYVTGDTAPRVTARSGGRLQISGSCVRFVAERPDATVSVVAPRFGVAIDPSRGPAAVGVRRFADSITDAGVVGPPMHARLRFATDRAQRPWTVTVRTSDVASVCSAA